MANMANNMTNKTNIISLVNIANMVNLAIIAQTYLNYGHNSHIYLPIGKFGHSINAEHKKQVGHSGYIEHAAYHLGYTAHIYKHSSIYTH